MSFEVDTFDLAQIQAGVLCNWSVLLEFAQFGLVPERRGPPALQFQMRTAYNCPRVFEINSPRTFCLREGRRSEDEQRQQTDNEAPVSCHVHLQLEHIILIAVTKKRNLFLILSSASCA
jgi:hypothetical protein